MTGRFRLKFFVVAASLLSLSSDFTNARSPPSMADVGDAIRGFVKLDAMTAWCTGQREATFRNNMLAIIAISASDEKQQNYFIGYYDRQYTGALGWQERFIDTEEKRSKYCSVENFAQVKKGLEKLARKVNYPGF